MGRSTFEGPILAGDNRFGPQRDVGTTVLSQYAFLNFATTTAGTAGYGGGSTIFINSNGIPNNIATIYAPQAGVFSNTGPTTGTTPTADASGTIYRGAVFLLPASSYIQDIIIDSVLNAYDGTTNATTLNAYASNAFNTGTTPLYGASGAITTYSGSANVPVRTAMTFTQAQYGNAQSTLQDVQNIQPGQQPTWFSQVVVTLKFTTASLSTPTAGQVGITVRYVQADTNIGNSTTYPYGNFD